MMKRRDLNAAENFNRAGLARINACGHDNFSCFHKEMRRGIWMKQEAKEMHNCTLLAEQNFSCAVIK